MVSGFATAACIASNTGMNIEIIRTVDFMESLKKMSARLPILSGGPEAPFKKHQLCCLHSNELELFVSFLQH
jgi:hypothetical protein